jgi:outer membrane protein
MKNLVLLLLGASLVASPSAYAAEGRVAFVNASSIFEQYSGAKEAQRAYEKEMADLNEQVAGMEKDLQAFADTLEARKYLFSEDRLKEKRTELETKQQEYLRFRQDAEVKAARRNEELTKPIIQAIEDAAKQIAEKEGFDLVLDSSAGIVVYSRAESDLTDRVLQVLEEARQAGQAGGGQ